MNSDQAEESVFDWFQFMLSIIYFLPEKISLKIDKSSQVTTIFFIHWHCDSWNASELKSEAVKQCILNARLEVDLINIQDCNIC